MSSQSSASKKLLSLDGGGVRGISSMVILLAIMEKVKELEHDEGIVDDRERLPCRYFDLAGGTSTGGLAAIMLFRLEMTASQVIDQYQKMASKIFSDMEQDQGPFKDDEDRGFVGDALKLLDRLLGEWQWKKYLHLLIYNVFILFGYTRYSGRGLLAAVDDVAKGKEIGGQYAQFLDDSKPKMLLFTSIHKYGSKGIIRSYTPPKGDTNAPEGPLPKDLWDGLTLGRAARATTAAPYYFPITEVKNIKCVDGGLLNNNPVERVWDARYELATGGGKAPHVSLVVSLGTTKVPLTAIEGPKERPSTIILLHENSFLDRIFFEPAKQLVTALQDVVITFFKNPAIVLEHIWAIIDLATNTEEPHRDFESRMYYRNQCRLEQTEYFRFNADIPENRFISMDDVNGMEGLKKDTEAWLSSQDASAMVEKCAGSLAKQRDKLQF